MLYRLKGQYDIGVATPNATFSNILELRTSINPEEAFDLLLQRVKETTVYAHLHAEVPFEEVIKHNGIANPLYPFMLVLQNFAEEELNGINWMKMHRNSA